MSPGASAAGRDRPVYRHAELRRLLHPASIAVIGASTRAGSFGLRTLENLREYGGAVYPINAKYDRIGERKCFASLDDLPAVPDCAVIAVAQEAVEEATAACVAAGVGGVIVYASGYAETSRPELVALQQRLVDRVTSTPTRLLGPNCLGVSNYACSARMTFGRMPPPRPLGEVSIAIVAQSGALSMSLAQAVERGVSVSHAIPVGNAGDVNIADIVSYLAEDSMCQAVACVLEGVTDPRRLLEAGEIAWRAGKPVVVYKMATGQRGAAAAFSHTGALAGSTAANRAAFERAGFVTVDRLDDVIETTVFFAKAGRPKAHGVGVCSTSGGGGVMAADKAEEHGVELPQPGPATLAVLEKHIPEFGSRRNPCDLTAQVLNNEGAVEACADAMLADPQYSALVVHHTFADDVSTRRVPTWDTLARRHGKIICNYWSTEWLEGPGARECEALPGLATFRSLDRCFAALAQWHRLEERRRQEAAPVSRLSAPQVRGAAAAALAAAQGPVLAEREAKEVLALYGVPVVSERLVHDADAAVTEASRAGYPVVLKVESPDLPHKTEAGVIRLALADEAQVREAFAAVMANALRVTAAGRIRGVLVQPMVRGGIEVMVGGRIDPLFGPLVVVGLGGIFVELLRDVATALAPVGVVQARRMLEGLKGAAALRGFRGSRAVDLDRLAEVVVRISEFIADHADTLEELDVNPLICDGDRIVAVDALIRGRVTGNR